MESCISKSKLLLNGNKIINSNYLKEIPINKKYNFYADLFFHVTVNQ